MPGVGTNEDHEFALRSRLQRELRQFQDRLLEEESARAAAGNLVSGATLKAYARAAREQVRQSLELALGVERQAISMPWMNEELVEATTLAVMEEHVRDLEELALRFITKVRADGTEAARQAQALMPLRDDLVTHLRLARTGFGEEPTPTHLPSLVDNRVHYNMHVGSLSGSVIQQGANSQASISNVHLNQALDAAERLQALLHEQSQSSKESRDLELDVNAVVSQLKMDRPNVSVLSGLGHSVRNIAEGAAGGALSPAIVEGAKLLAGMLAGLQLQL
jgi:hypothetical protein